MKQVVSQLSSMIHEMWVIHDHSPESKFLIHQNPVLNCQIHPPICPTHDQDKKELWAVPLKKTFHIVSLFNQKGFE